MQHYLFGLGEVPSSWPQASLRAQAIAGRTYAYAKVLEVGQHRFPCDCGVYDSTLDQAYIGDAKRTGSGPYWDDWKAAVRGTKAVVIRYRGKPIHALYSSSSGGYTENIENVWGGEPLPYLRGVRDRADAVAANPNHRWSLRLSWRTFARKLRSYYGVGALRSFRLLRPFGVSGRVKVPTAAGGGARIVGRAKTVRVSGWSVRSALDLKDTLFRVRVAGEVARVSGCGPPARGAPSRGRVARGTISSVGGGLGVACR
jgi:peptidoglycan hydrolase-like amidase